MAITWIYENEGERSYVQRQDGLNEITVLTWSNVDRDDATMFIRSLKPSNSFTPLERNWSLGDGRSLNAARNADRVVKDASTRGPTPSVAATVCSCTPGVSWRHLFPPEFMLGERGISV